MKQVQAAKGNAVLKTTTAAPQLAAARDAHPHTKQRPRAVAPAAAVAESSSPKSVVSPAAPVASHATTLALHSQVVALNHEVFANAAQLAALTKRVHGAASQAVVARDPQTVRELGQMQSHFMDTANRMQSLRLKLHGLGQTELMGWLQGAQDRLAKQMQEFGSMESSLAQSAALKAATTSHSVAKKAADVAATGKARQHAVTSRAKRFSTSSVHPVGNAGARSGGSTRAPVMTSSEATEALVDNTHTLVVNSLKPDAGARSGPEIDASTSGWKPFDAKAAGISGRYIDMDFHFPDVSGELTAQGRFVCTRCGQNWGLKPSDSTPGRYDVVSSDRIAPYWTNKRAARQAHATGGVVGAPSHAMLVRTSEVGETSLAFELEFPETSQVHLLRRVDH